MAMVRFGDVATRVNTKEDRFNTDLVYYVGGDHIETGALTVSGRGVIKDADLGPMFYFGFKPGDILFVTRNPHLRKAAKVDFAGICSEKTLVIATKDESVLLQDYLAGVMQSDDFWDFMEENKSGSVNYFINWSTLADYEFDLPPIEKQRELAELLWAANNLKESYKKLIVATDEMLKAKFRVMFGAVVYNDKLWPDKKLGEVVRLINGRAYAKDELLQTGRYPILRVGNFFTNESWYYSDMELDADKYCNSGDLLFAWSASFGPRIWDGGKVIYHYHIWKVEHSSDFDRDWLYWFLLEIAEDVKGHTHGSTMVHTTKGDMENRTIPLPPLSLQREFVAIARKADETKAALKKSIADVESVIKGLING